MIKNITERCIACGYITITTEEIGEAVSCMNPARHCRHTVRVSESLDIQQPVAPETGSREFNSAAYDKDPVNHPPHYKTHPSGIECIQITEHMDFLKGNAIKYIWRAGSKGSEIEDLEKAKWYLERRITMLRERPAAMYP